jgi:hypothetical protein
VSIPGDEIEKLRRYAREKAAEAAEYKAQNKFLLKEQKKLKRRLDRVYSSWTWRAGRVVLFPLHLGQKFRDKRTASPK